MQRAAPRLRYWSLPSVAGRSDAFSEHLARWAVMSSVVAACGDHHVAELPSRWPMAGEEEGEAGRAPLAGAMGMAGRAGAAGRTGNAGATGEAGDGQQAPQVPPPGPWGKGCVGPWPLVSRGRLARRCGAEPPAVVLSPPPRRTPFEESRSRMRSRAVSAKRTPRRCVAGHQALAARDHELRDAMAAIARDEGVSMPSLPGRWRTGSSRSSRRPSVRPWPRHAALPSPSCARRPARSSSARTSARWPACLGRRSRARSSISG